MWGWREGECGDGREGECGDGGRGSVGMAGRGSLKVLSELDSTDDHSLMSPPPNSS